MAELNGVQANYAQMLGLMRMIDPSLGAAHNRGKRLNDGNGAPGAGGVPAEPT